MDTKNLNFRKLTLEDVEEVYGLTAREEVARYMRFGQHQHQQQARELVEAYINGPGYKAFVIEEKVSKQFVGIFVFKQDEQDASIYSMTTFNHPDFWNKGYGAESLEVMKSYAKDILKAKSLQAYVITHNKGSCRILEKNEFKVTKHLTFEDLEGELLVYELRLD